MPRQEQSFESVDSAVAAAKRLHGEEGFDLFRGQRRPWPVVSTFRRLALERRDEAFSRVNQFVNWAQQEPSLLRYGFSGDQAIAVAQHYGIPTTFIDFTTDIEVARHFATESSKDESPDEYDGKCCIIAAHSDRFKAWVAQRFKQSNKFLGPQIVRIDVANLWRLEAQAGVFIVDDELLDAYPFEYLVFPAPRTPVPLWDRRKVYPDERSDLELIVEQWFWHEHASARTRWMKQEFLESGVALQELAEGPTDGIGLKGIIRPGPHPS
jgi:hypothetical protein